MKTLPKWSDFLNWCSIGSLFYVGGLGGIAVGLIQFMFYGLPIMNGNLVNGLLIFAYPIAGIAIIFVCNLILKISAHLFGERARSSLNVFLLTFMSIFIISQEFYSYYLEKFYSNNYVLSRKEESDIAQTRSDFDSRIRTLTRLQQLYETRRELEPLSQRFDDIMHAQNNSGRNVNSDLARQASFILAEMQIKAGKFRPPGVLGHVFNLSPLSEINLQIDAENKKLER